MSNFKNTIAAFIWAAALALSGCGGGSLEVDPSVPLIAAQESCTLYYLRVPEAQREASISAACDQLLRDCGE